MRRNILSKRYLRAPAESKTVVIDVANDALRTHHLRMVDDLIAHPSALRSEWEREFLRSIRGQLAGGRDLSVKQLANLERLYERVVGTLRVVGPTLEAIHIRRTRYGR